VHWFNRCIDYVDRMTEAIAHAHQLGTYGKADRSKQYPLTTDKQIIDAVNLALTKVRLVEKSKDEEIAKLKKVVSRYRWAEAILISVVTSVLTGLCWESAKAFVAWLAYR
jgi:hypothetical protein